MNLESGSEEEDMEEEEEEEEEDPSSSEDEDEQDHSSQWIDPCLLEDKVEDSICALCFGLLAKPVSGCPEGHSFCRVCYIKALRERRLCPTCRHPADKSTLVANRTAENLIAQLRVRCEHAPKESVEEAGSPTAKRAKLAPPTVD
ncbi:hypothetical protein T484DRAFT_1765258, partial [Baffinella frigidus]